MTDKNDACKQAWERYAETTAYYTQTDMSYTDFAAGFNAGYAAALQSTPAEPTGAKPQTDRATVQSSLERRLGVKLAAKGWYLELADSVEYDLVTPFGTDLEDTRMLDSAVSNGTINVSTTGRYRIL
jgi:hypothetical protein